MAFASYAIEPDWFWEDEEALLAEQEDAYVLAVSQEALTVSADGLVWWSAPVVTDDEDDDLDPDWLLI